MFFKNYVNNEEKSISDGFTDGFKNLGKSKNIEVIKCIKHVFNFSGQKFNYISEIIILASIIEIICIFNCERGIKIYIGNLINFSNKYIHYIIKKKKNISRNNIIILINYK